MAVKKNARRFHKLTDRHVEAMFDFSEDAEPTFVWDSKVHGLRLRVGKHKATWTFFREHRRRGKRSTTHRRLGYWSPIPGEGMTVAAARKAAEALSGRIAGGHIETGKRHALTFSEAFDDYCQYLLKKATAAQKEPLWHRVVTGLGKLYLKPQWDGWTLAEISRAPKAVQEWHEDVSKRAGAVTGNKVAKILRAAYRYAGRLRRDLPPELPTSGVVMNPEEPREAGMTDAQHRKWADAWRKIELPSRRAYHLLACLTGQRPGELARLKVADVDFAERRFTIRKAKASNNIMVPISPPIEAALRMALKAHDGKSEWLFPARAGGHIRRFDSDGLPLCGNGLRHNYKNIAVTMKPAVEEILTEFLQGHAPKGVSRKYVSTMILAKSDALHEAQARISARIMILLQLTTADLRAP